MTYRKDFGRKQVFDPTTLNLSRVATTGSYNDLSNQPTLFSGAYSDLTGKPELFSGSYLDLTNQPTIPAAQVQTDWSATSGMGVILNKPTIPTVPLVAYYSTTTNASGVWSVTISGFATVNHVDVIAVNTAATAAGARIATLTSFSTTAATGTVCLANSITSILGLLGLGLAGAGVTVRVRVEGN